MYKVYCDDILIHDVRNRNLILFNPVLNLEDNTSGSFTFTIAESNKRYHIIEKLKSVITVFEDDQELFCGRVIDEDIDFYKQKKFYCEGELGYFNDSIQRQAEYHDMTVRGFLETLINVHNSQVEDRKKFSIGAVTVTDPNDSLYRYTNYEKTLECIKEKLINKLGGHIQIRKYNGIKYIDYLDGFPSTNSQIVEFGVNLLDFSQNMSAADFATVVIPLGNKLEESTIEALEERLTIKTVNNGMDYIVSPDAAETFGKISKVVIWDDVSDPTILKTKGQNWLADAQYENLVIKAKVIDLHYINKTKEKIKLLQKIRVKSKPHGLDRMFPVTKMTIDLLKPNNNTITMGVEDRKSLTKTLSTSNSAIFGKIEDIPSKSNILKEAQDNATQLIMQGLGGYVFVSANEILVMDTDDKATATEVWRWNSGGFGYSSTGYDGEYGTAITMDGKIVADFITAGTMYADRIKGGTLTLGGADNVDGLLKVLNALGVVTVRADKDGLYAISGVIGGFNIFADYLGTDYSETGTAGIKMMQSNGNIISWKPQYQATLAPGVLKINTGAVDDKGVTVYNTSTGTSNRYARLSHSTLTIIGSEETYAGAGSVQVGTSSQNALLDKTGVHTSSDRNLKQDIMKLDEISIKILENLLPCTFTYKSDIEKRMHFGFVAQDIVALLKKLSIKKTQIVTKNGSGFYKLNMNELLAIVVKGWQEHNKKIQNLEKEIDLLRKGGN